MPIVWIYRGPWANQLQHLTDEELARAEAEDWGQDIVGKDGSQMKPVDRSPHPAAERFFASKTGAPLAPAKAEEPVKPEPQPEPAPPPQHQQTYPTRELRPEPMGDTPRVRKPIPAPPPKRKGR